MISMFSGIAKEMFYSHFKHTRTRLSCLAISLERNLNFQHAIEEFLIISDLYGYTPVFYESSNDMLPILHENGFDFFKLGKRHLSI